MNRYLILIVAILLVISSPAIARHAPKHALLVKHAITVLVTVHIPAAAYQKAVRRRHR